MIPVSINMVVRNEEARLQVLLPLLQDFDEVVVVDQESTDSTFNLCKSFGYKVLTDKATGYADTSRALCMSESKNNWILTLDADEFITNRFKEDIPFLIDNPRYDGILCCMAHIVTNDDIPIEDVLNMGYVIDKEHHSKPYCWRLYHKDRVHIEGKLHTGVRPRHNDIGLYLHYNALVEIKSQEELNIDVNRYKSVVYNCYHPELFP
jgi:glycosyltransferase involved in cell wall biosynthesis